MPNQYTSFIPLEVKQKCIELHKSGMGPKEIYDTYYCKREDVNTKINAHTFRSSLTRWEQKLVVDDKILEGGNLGFQFTPHDATVQVSANGDVIQAWVKSKTTSQDTYNKLIEFIKTQQPLAYLNLNSKLNIRNAARMLEIPLFDLHFGIADFDYYKDTLEEVIEVIRSKAWAKIIIPIGQDLFHNDDFRGRTSSGRPIQKTPMDAAWEHATQFYYSLIFEAIAHSKECVIIYTRGNHDESMSWAFVKLMEAHFQNQCTFDTSLKWRKAMTFGENFIGLTHGDKINKKIVDLRGAFTYEFPVEFASCKVREIHAGHLHSEQSKDNYGVMVRRLSTKNITDEWHDEEGFVGAHKRFMLFEWTTKKLSGIHYI